MVLKREKLIATFSARIFPSKKTTVAIALGSNLGNSQATLELAIDLLDRAPGITVKTRSSWYETAPIGPSQPDYLNGCAILEVEREPHSLLGILLDIEREFGRVRLQRWGPRTLDLDLLLFGSLILETPELQIPHPRMRERAFVLVPLAEIAPEWIEPVSGEAIAQLVEKVDRCGVKKQELN
ncbi:MAG: 2-amino-4-hydroxy-6-hydroxymethyldihydropteridine diphosphokinase [Cyanobacteriota bacterium]|nr:2-amino-4-hydroxy-6-hydroxymethyldihydropteridine diphosphokinase [Cyanobacteriota bacterium]